MSVRRTNPLPGLLLSLQQFMVGIPAEEYALNSSSVKQIFKEFQNAGPALLTDIGARSYPKLTSKVD